MKIDFQARIDSNPEYPFLIALETARFAMTVLNPNFEYMCSVHKMFNGIECHAKHRNTNEFSLFEFDLAGRTIDAALLEQLHNEVTAWFTKIKEGAAE